MPSIAPSACTTSTRVARIPYLNSVPFFRGLPLDARCQLIDCVPRELGAKAAAGEVAAGLLPVADFFRLQDSFERLGRFGIAVRGRTRSTLLFSRKPIRQLDGATVALTEESSTTACLTRLLLEQRYHVTPAGYPRGRPADADALLLIGDEALRFQRTNTLYPFEVDVGFEWWLWQHLPFVFAVWAIRKETSAEMKRALELGLTKSLAMNQRRFDDIAKEYAGRLDIPEADLHLYLSSFIYRLGQPEEEGVRRFKELLGPLDPLVAAATMGAISDEHRV